MPENFQIQLKYNAGKSGFGEVYYRSGDSAQQAAESISQLRINQLRGVHASGVTLVSITATEVSGLRRSFERKINQTNPRTDNTITNPDAGRPDITGVCASVKFGFTDRGGRIVSLRGLGDRETIRSYEFIDQPSALFSQLLETYCTAVRALFLGQRLVDSGPTGMPWINVVSLAPHATNSEWTLVTVQAQTQISATGQVVYFQHVDRAVFPGLRGLFQVTQFVSNTQFAIPYRYREASAVTELRKTQVRRAVYEYPALVGGEFVKFGVRKTGRPFGLDRGRSSGLKLRQ